MPDVYNKKDVLDILSNLYNNLPPKAYSDLRKSILQSANKIINLKMIYFNECLLSQFNWINKYHNSL